MRSIKNEQNNFRFKNIRKKIVSKKKRKDTKRQPYHQQGGGVTFSDEVLDQLDTAKIKINEFFYIDKNCNKVIELIYETNTYKSLNFFKKKFIDLVIIVAIGRLKNDLMELIDKIFINFQHLAPNLILRVNELIFTDTKLVTQILGYFTENGTKEGKERMNNLYRNKLSGTKLDDNIKEIDNILNELLEAISIDVEVNSENKVTQLVQFRMGKELKCNLLDNTSQLADLSLKRDYSLASTASLDSSSDEEYDKAETPPTVNTIVTLIVGVQSD